MAVAQGKGSDSDLKNRLPQYLDLFLCKHWFSKFKILLTHTALDYLHFLKLQIKVVLVYVDNVS